MKKTGLTILALFIGSFLIQSCSPSTKVLSSWKDPEAHIDPDHLDKVMVGVLSPQEASRRKSEEQISTYHKSFVPSYQVLGTQEIILDTAQSKAILKRQGFDGALLFRLVDKEKSTTYVPGSTSYGTGYGGYGGYGGGYWGYHSAYYGSYYDPGYYVEDVNYVVETILYSFEKNKLIWTALTTTSNPSDRADSIDDIVSTVFEQMRRDGLFITPEEEAETK